MILKFLKIFAYIYKNRLLTDTLLENNKDFNILLFKNLFGQLFTVFKKKDHKYSQLYIVNHIFKNIKY